MGETVMYFSHSPIPPFTDSYTSEKEHTQLHLSATLLVQKSPGDFSAGGLNV